mgnify:CR=1 FL=1
MKQGFVKVAAASCAVVVADVRENTRVILETIHKMEGEGAKVMVLPVPSIIVHRLWDCQSD